MTFGCFTPSADVYATLPKGVALADPASALSRRHSARPAPTNTAFSGVGNDALNRAATTGGIGYKVAVDQNGRRKLTKGMISKPTGFVHLSHVGQDDITRVADDENALTGISAALAGAASPSPPPPIHAHSLGSTPTAPAQTKARDESAEHTPGASPRPEVTVNRLPLPGSPSDPQLSSASSRPASPSPTAMSPVSMPGADANFVSLESLLPPIPAPSRPLSPDPAASEPDSCTEQPGYSGEEGNAFGGRSRSPPPAVITGAGTAPLRVKKPGNTSLAEPKQIEVTILEKERKIKRKAAPAYVPSKIMNAQQTQGSTAGASDKENAGGAPQISNEKVATILGDDGEPIELPMPLDAKGRPMHLVGGRYLTDTTKVKWEGAMDEITRALRQA